MSAYGSCFLLYIYYLLPCNEPVHVDSGMLKEMGKPGGIQATFQSVKLPTKNNTGFNYIVSAQSSSSGNNNEERKFTSLWKFRSIKRRKHNYRNIILGFEVSCFVDLFLSPCYVFIQEASECWLCDRYFSEHSLGKEQWTKLILKIWLLRTYIERMG